MYITSPYICICTCKASHNNPEHKPYFSSAGGRGRIWGGGAQAAGWCDSPYQGDWVSGYLYCWLTCQLWQLRVSSRRLRPSFPDRERDCLGRSPQAAPWVPPGVPRPGHDARVTSPRLLRGFSLLAPPKTLSGHQGHQAPRGPRKPLPGQMPAWAGCLSLARTAWLINKVRQTIRDTSSFAKNQSGTRHKTFDFDFWVKQNIMAYNNSILGSCDFPVWIVDFGLKVWWNKHK